MRDVVIFGEDVAHEIVLVALTNRLADEVGLDVKVTVRSSTGGHGLMVNELSQFLRVLAEGRTSMPDLIIVGRDANCQGYQQCRKSLEAALSTHVLPARVFALPDPHIERWLLDDSA